MIHTKEVDEKIGGRGNGLKLHVNAPARGCQNGSSF